MPCSVPCPVWVLFQVVVEGSAASVELQNLTASTEYLVSVLPVYEGGVGKGLRGLATTGGWVLVVPALPSLQGLAPAISDHPCLSDPGCPLLTTASTPAWPMAEVTAPSPGISLWLCPVPPGSPIHSGHAEAGHHAFQTV